jgi:hypothetical protein
MNKLTDIKLPKKLKKRIQKNEDAPKEQISGELPRITNDNIATHREDVLKNARKYIYPLQQSKNRIVIITTTIVIVALVAFFSYCTLALYKFGGYSSFLYRVTQVIPFPVARVDGHFVDYQNYLFELEDYVHYYQTQQDLNFSTSSGQKQLDNYKERALDKVVDDAYIEELAKQNNVTVSNQQINNQITIDREENRLGSSQSVFQNVLKSYYGWSINDFKRELKTTLLAQDLVSKLDTGTHERANTVLGAISAGQDFATLAQQNSDDAATKSNGGQYGFLISQDNVNVPSQVVQALFKLKPGQTTGIINTGYSLEIDKVISINNNQIQAAHIVFNFQDISNYLNPLKEKQPARVYIKIP